ncbi:MAG: hypothetical protein FJ296_01385, partial [Planctomycetes bacterium]|nr:hypothetical protein [Planctomycetota bacterium]
MSKSPRGGLLVGGVVLVAAIVLVVYLAGSEGGRGKDPTAPVVGAARPAEEPPPAFNGTVPTPVESLVPEGAG